ncbi:MAG: DNA recombination protein RmuC [Lewinella sp.]|jgi:DNA recombination protein RmuC|uniref:DNA recombination protein RmuC n=1 Tax=Lewinella sp. TaxID=2004506 RepID=UPI003D6A2B9D
MADPLLLAFLFLVIGLLLGFVLGYWWQRLKVSNDFVSSEQIAVTYVSKAVHEALLEHTDVLQANLHEKTETERDLSSALATEKARLEYLQEKLDVQMKEMQELQQTNRLTFESLANRLLEEKSKKFTEQNHSQLQHLLGPLKEKIKTFEDNIERRYLEETRDRVSLKKEIEQLRDLNQQLSQDAGNLTAALKGDNKTQGDWGEVQLELLLEKAGLQKEVHYRTQSSFRDQEGKLKRPDFIINLPENKHLVIDCKVSLTAYDRYCSAEDDPQRAKALKQHLESVRAHIKGLSKKKYQDLYQINSPDYLLLFIPIEPAFALAVQQDQRLFLDALDDNIVIVTNSTMLATMRTVSYIWKQEKQQRSVQEIARQSGQLYDKFVNFVEDLQLVGQRLDSTHNAYSAAMYKLSEGKRYNQTLVGRAEKLRKLGARTSKQLPEAMRQEEE